MKLQDLIFLAVLAFLLLQRKPSFFVIAGVFCLVLSIPLFSLWIFFTAERLTWYAAAFFLCAALFFLRSSRRVQ